MLRKVAIVLPILLALGASSSAYADYQFDASGAPTNMHLVPPPSQAAARNALAYAPLRQGAVLGEPVIQDGRVVGRATDPNVWLELRRDQYRQ